MCQAVDADAQCWWAGAQSERSSLGGQTPTQWAPYSLCCGVFNLSASLLFTHIKLQKRGVTTLSDPKHDTVWMKMPTWSGSCWRPQRRRSYETLVNSLMIFLTLRCSPIAGIFQSEINCCRFSEWGIQHGTFNFVHTGLPPPWPRARHLYTIVSSPLHLPGLKWELSTGLPPGLQAPLYFHYFTDVTGRPSSVL